MRYVIFVAYLRLYLLYLGSDRRPSRTSFLRERLGQILLVGGTSACAIHFLLLYFRISDNGIFKYRLFKFSKLSDSIFH